MSFQHSKKENPQMGPSVIPSSTAHPGTPGKGVVRLDHRQLEDQHCGSKEGSRGRRGVVLRESRSK